MHEHIQHTKTHTCKLKNTLTHIQKIDRYIYIYIHIVLNISICEGLVWSIMDCVWKVIRYHCAMWLQRKTGKATRTCTKYGRQVVQKCKQNKQPFSQIGKKPKKNMCVNFGENGNRLCKASTNLVMILVMYLVISKMIINRKKINNLGFPMCGWLKLS